MLIWEFKIRFIFLTFNRLTRRWWTVRACLRKSSKSFCRQHIMKRAAVRGRVPLARCKVLTNECRLKSSRLIFYEKRSSKFIASGLQTSSVRHLYGHIILAAQCSSTAREAKKRRLDKSYDKWCPCFWFFAQLSKPEKKACKGNMPWNKMFSVST